MTTLSTVLRNQNIERDIQDWAKGPIKDPVLELDRATQFFQVNSPKIYKQKQQRSKGKQNISYPKQLLAQLAGHSFLKNFLI